MFPTSDTRPGVDPQADARAQTRPQRFVRDPISKITPPRDAVPAGPSDETIAGTLKAMIKVVDGWAPIELVSIGMSGFKIRLPGGPPPTRAVVVAVRPLDGAGATVKLLGEIAGKRREVGGTLLRVTHKQLLCSGGRQDMVDFLQRIIRFDVVPRAALRTGSEGVYFDFERATRPVSERHGQQQSVSTSRLRTRR